MFDAIGLGGALANMIYLILGLLFVGGAIFFLIKKNLAIFLVWASVILNVFLMLFLMGNYRYYPVGMYIVVDRIWPIINGVLIVLLIINFIKNKNVKTK